MILQNAGSSSNHWTFISVVMMLVYLLMLGGLVNIINVAAEVTLFQVETYQNEECSGDVWFATLESIADECSTTSSGSSKRFSCEPEEQQFFATSNCTGEVTNSHSFDECANEVPNMSFIGRCVSYPDDKVLHYHTGQACNGEGGLTKPNTLDHLVILDSCTILPYEVVHSFTLTLANDGSGTLTLTMYAQSGVCDGSLITTYTLKIGECGLAPFKFTGFDHEGNAAVLILPVVEGAIPSETTTKTPTQSPTQDKSRAIIISTSVWTLVFLAVSTLFAAILV